MLIKRIDVRPGQAVRPCTGARQGPAIYSAAISSTCGNGMRQLLGRHRNCTAAIPNPCSSVTRRMQCRMGSNPYQSAGPSSSPSPDAQGTNKAAEVERSALINEEIVYFIFQLDLDTQLQRALNYEAYEQATAIRSKRQRVDEALDSMRERKAVNLSEEGADVAPSLADVAAEGLRLRTAMARAIEREDYKEAATLRDTIAGLEAQAKRSQSLAERTSGGAAFAPRLRLGQRIMHRDHGYRGVVVGWDARCCEGEEWVARVGAGAAARAGQPHYHILVDQRDWDYDSLQPPVAYVAEELCWVPERGGLPPPNATVPLVQPTGADVGADADGVLPEGASWAEAFGLEGMAHPYMYIVFLGQDARGDYVPCRQLRSKYNIARRDVPRSQDKGQDGDQDSSRN